MIDLSHAGNQVQCVNNFQELLATPFHEKINAICWTRNLMGDFSEIVNNVECIGNIVEINQGELREMQLSEPGKLAREILLNDLDVLKAHGASPVLNLIKYYERDDIYPSFPTDVYSFHVDRSPIAVDTFLCTYQGESSEIVSNAQAKQKILIPEIRSVLQKLYHGADDGFESFLSEHFFDLHYQANHEAGLTNLGNGHLWKLAIDHPESKVSPCIHRAPNEKTGESRLMLIC